MAVVRGINAANPHCFSSTRTSRPTSATATRGTRRRSRTLSRLTKARCPCRRAGSRAGFTTRLDDKWRELGVFDLDTLGQRKVAARQLHDALLAWEAGVEAVAYEKPPTDVMTAMTFLAFGHWA